MKKIVTGSHSGTGWWLMQRFSAVVLLFAGLLLWFAWLTAPAPDYAAWRAMFRPQAMRLLLWLWVASLCLHAWVGLRDVLMDYVRPIALRLALDLLVTLMLLAATLWTAAILWGGHG